MHRDPLESQTFDPAQAEVPPLPEPPGEGGGFVLLVAAGEGDREWAEHAAASLASGWARQGRRILLADLSLQRPGLHRVLGVDNGEGVSDTFLFGSSIQRVARPVRDLGFLFVPAGTATARPGAVTGSPRWGAVVEGCARVHATLVVFLPADLPGGETLLDRASDVVLLAGRSAPEGAELRAGFGDRLRAVLVPPAGADGAGSAALNGSGPVLEEAHPTVAEPTLGFGGLEDESPLGSLDGLADLGTLPDQGGREPSMNGLAELGDGFGIDRAQAPEPEGSWAAGDLDGLDHEGHEGLGLVGPDLDVPDGIGEPAADAAPTFGGELSFVEPELVALTPEPDLAGPSPTGAGDAIVAPSGGSDLRAPDLPMREPQPASERPPRPSLRFTERPAPRVEPKPPPRKSRAGLLILLLLLVVGILVAAAWFGLVEIPWLSERLGTLRGNASPAITVAAAPPDEPVGTTVNENAVALTLDSFTDPALARLQAVSLNDQRPDLLFVVAPVRLGGTIYHRLLAGPAADSAGAEALRATLATLLTRENPVDWVLRPTPLAFHMGDRDDLAGAAERVAELSGVDIPAYVLELPGRTAVGVSIPRYRVYAGAYADEQEAAYLRELLLSKGFPDASLVPRVGRHPR